MSIDLDWFTQEFPELTEIEPLNHGGQKFVMSAHHSDEGPVVLKLIKPSQQIETIRREILAVKSIQSNRVPEILEYGQVSTNIGDCFWFREVQIIGQTLQKLISNGPLDTQRLLLLGLHVLETLVEAEQAGIVHRDVKPGNIVCDSSNIFWLLDFGLARHLQLESITPTENHFGKFTAGYAPPEQFRNLKNEIDSRADLFGLGVTLYESATGLNPFRQGARDVLEILKRVESFQLPRMSLDFAECENFNDLVITLTQKNRIHRPESARDAFMWMKEICENEGITC